MQLEALNCVLVRNLDAGVETGNNFFKREGILTVYNKAFLKIKIIEAYSRNNFFEREGIK